MRNYYKAQGMFGIPRKGECDYSVVLELDLARYRPSVAGPKRPQDRIELPQLKEQFSELLLKPVSEGGYGKSDEEMWLALLHVEIGADRHAKVALAAAVNSDPEPVPVAAGGVVTPAEHQRLDRNGNG